MHIYMYFFFLLFLVLSFIGDALDFQSRERHPVSSADGCATNKIFHEAARDSVRARARPS